MKFLPTSITQALGRKALVTSKHAPSLLFGAGVVGTIGSTILACRATLKLESVIFETQNDLDTAKTMDHPNYSDEDRRRDIAVIYARSAVGMAKLYGPSILLGSVSIGLLTKSHNLLQERNAALAAAYTAVDKAFNEYRERVRAKHGEEEDQEFRYGSEEVAVVNEKGRTETRRRVAPGEPSMYARFFDQMSVNWSKEPEYNLVFLRCQQNYANDMLKTRGHVFLNEVYDMLGLERTKAGQVVGWVISRDGDNYIDFGIYAGQDEKVRDFVNGREGALLLDFNVDGVIYDKIGDEGERVSWQR